MRAKLDAARLATPGVYERHAARWHAQRPPLSFEREWLDRWLSCLKRAGARARLLDLGCGSGHPVGAYLLELGHEVVGVDRSPAMIAIAHSTLPEGEWKVADMRELPETGLFDGVVSWDGWFHLSPSEQREALPTLAARVAAGGAILLTVGPEAGEVTGTVGRETVYHASLSPETYEKTLRASGFTEVAFKREDTEAGGRSVLMAWGKADSIR